MWLSLAESEKNRKQKFLEEMEKTPLLRDIGSPISYSVQSSLQFVFGFASPVHIRGSDFLSSSVYPNLLIGISSDKNYKNIAVSHSVSHTFLSHFFCISDTFFFLIKIK